MYSYSLSKYFYEWRWISLWTSLPFEKEDRNRISIFFTSFLCARPVVMLAISKPVAQKNCLLLPNLSVQPFTNACREWWIRWVRNQPTHERTVRSSTMCAYASWIGYRMDIISDGRLVGHYVTDERNTSCCVFSPITLDSCFHACQLSHRITDRRVEDHVPICI